jgi:hypothetical protein
VKSPRLNVENKHTGWVLNVSVYLLDGERRYAMDFNLDDPVEFEMAKLWTRAFLLSMRDGGIWIVPRSASIYVIDRGHKKLIKLTGRDEPSIELIITAIGWTVEQGPQEENIL